MQVHDNAQELLQLLASSDEFRALMESDPATALGRFDIHLEDTPSNVVLPSKLEASQGANRMARQAESQFGWEIFAR